jgi:hypothetical protein
VRRTKRQQLLSLAVSLAAAGVLIAVCLDHRPQLAAALRKLPPSVFAATVAIHVLALLARSEAWFVTLAAIDGRGAPRRAVHFASAGGFLVGTVSGHATLPLRMLLLRRLAPRNSPPLRDMLVADAPIYALEASIAAALVPLAAGALGVPWWAALAAPLAAAVGLVLLRRAHGFASRRGLVRGLAILANVSRRRRLVAFVLAFSSLTFARLWLLLAWCGLPHGIGQATLLFITAGVLSLLPLGPAAGPAATLVATGGAHVGPAAAAGLGITGSSFAGVVVYGLAVLGTRLGRSQPDHVEFSST